MIIAHSTFPQSINKSKDSNYIRLASSRWNLDKYLWGFAKNKVGKHDKPIIDFNAIDSWQRMGDYLSISHDGKYFAYTIESVREPFDSYRNVDSLIVQSTDNSWRMTFVEAASGFFSK